MRHGCHVSTRDAVATSASRVCHISITRVTWRRIYTHAEHPRHIYTDLATTVHLHPVAIATHRGPVPPCERVAVCGSLWQFCGSVCGSVCDSVHRFRVFVCVAVCATVCRRLPVPQGALGVLASVLPTQASGDRGQEHGTVVPGRGEAALNQGACQACAGRVPGVCQACAGCVPSVCQACAGRVPSVCQARAGRVLKYGPGLLPRS